MDLASAEKLLAEHGLAELLPATLVARRPGCTVWQLSLFSPYGDATAEVQIYPLAEDPASVADLEEEITALEDSSDRTLARELRDSNWGILVIRRRADQALFQKFFEEGIPKERTIAYHPELDRILGEDHYLEENGRWVKRCLVSLPRAMRLRDLVHAAEAAYKAAGPWEGKLERPLPVLYAILQLPFGFPGAPPEYDELTQMVFGIESPRPVEAAPPAGREAMSALARQLFGAIAALHSAGICFSRDAGSCLRPEFVAPDGSLLDVYFLCKPDGEAALRGTMDRDNWNALDVICGLCSDDALMTTEIITVAIRSYVGRPQFLPAEQLLIRSAAHDAARGNQDSLRALVRTSLFKSDSLGVFPR